MSLEHGHTAPEIAKRLTAATRRGNLRDVVYGGIDGAVTTFAIVSGVEGAGLPSNVIVVLGLANILADGFSMAAGNYSATKAEADDAMRLRAMEERHIAVTPEGELEELRQILARKGLEGRVLREATEAIAAKRSAWIEMMMVEEHGVAPSTPAPLRAGLVTFGAFLLAGFVPLLPFLAGMPFAFLASTLMTGCVFFGIGTLKSRWSLASWWRSGLETLSIGAAAAAIAYGVGSLFQI
ncbi:MAG: VIT1/CCC1 transporter family protein [Pseudomonadota bacterium]